MNESRRRRRSRCRWTTALLWIPDCEHPKHGAPPEIDLSRCIFCGYCEVACPFDAITMGHDNE